MKIFHQIQFKIFILFAALLMLVLGMVSWLLRWEVRRDLEAELGQKMEAIASAAAVHFTAEERKLMTFSTGSSVRRRFTKGLLDICRATGVKRIYIFKLDQSSIADTDSTIAPGALYFSLQFHQTELASIERGINAHSILFTGIDGQPVMTGFAPLYAHGQVIGGVAVNGNANVLDGMRLLEQRLLWLSAGAITLTLMLAWLLARTLSGPIHRLARRSHAIGQGDLENPVSIQGKGEIANLANAMEDMRQGLLAREKEVKAMVGGVAHEIRNPLGGMGLYADLLSDHLIEGSTPSDHLHKIQREIVQLQRIVDHFLDFARPRTPEACHVNLAKLAEEAVELCTTQHKTPAEIQINIGNLLSAHIDPGHGRQIFINLLSNAFQAAGPDGKIKITGTTTKDRHVQIQICDNGSGLCKEALDNLYTPFHTSRSQGTGLGLAIAKNLAQRNKGDIRLLSSNSSGTIFEIEMPLTK